METKPMEPSREAVEAAMIAKTDAGCIDPDCQGCIKDMLTDAYAIDFTALQQVMQGLADALADAIPYIGASVLVPEIPRERFNAVLADAKKKGHVK